MVQTFLHLDPATISSTRKAEIRSNHSGLTDVSCDIGTVRFTPVVFCHALMLLGQHPQRFGYDLSVYLATVNVFFQNTTQGEFLVIGEGSADFKKRIAEDLGVGLASLFMVTAFRLRWETIAQIPVNRKLSKYRPDFLGFNKDDQRFIYEAKGTTQPNKVEEAMGKALAQSKSYPEEALAKFAIVSYFPSGGKQMPPFTFVADPPISELFPPDPPSAIMLHYVSVLEYCGFQRTRVACEALLLEAFARERKGEPLARYRRYFSRERVSDVTKMCESENREEFTWNERVFVGRYLKARHGESQALVFLGVDKDYLERIFRLEVDLPNREEVVVQSDEALISVFSDGTMLRVGPG